MSEQYELTVALAHRLQLPNEALQVSAHTGGDTCRALRIDSGRQAYFVKLNRRELLSMFEAERLGLEQIARISSLRVPQVVHTGVCGQQAYLAMEFIEMQPLADGPGLARALADLHQLVHPRFGFFADNWIGGSEQPNGFDTDWVRFWRRRRLNFQLELLKVKSGQVALIDAGFRLSENLARLFDNYQPRPSLLHGDLWSGNRGADNAGNPVLYDPACYFGDHEADLAMMELFGNPGPRFFAAYRECFPIDPGYVIRRDLYNLYHILNHANLFGGAYFAQASQMTRQLLANL